MRILSNVSASLTVAILAASSLAIGLQPTPAKPEQPATQPKAEPPKADPKTPPAVEPGKDGAKPTPAAPADPFVLGHKVVDIDGKEHDLSEWKGQVILIVNTASKCGNTGQYTGLEALYQDKKDQGFVILAFPSGDFNNQEYGENEEIKKFCQGDGSQYKITFPLFSKVHVKGDKVHPLFKQLTGQPAPIGGDAKWNFTKWLVDRSGKVVARYEFRIKPDDMDLKKRITELLGKAK